MCFKYYKKLDLALTISSVICVSTGSIVGSITLNPIIIGSLTSIGVLIKTISEYKNFKRKIEMYKFACTSYEKILIDIRSYLRGLEFNEQQFLDYVKTIDDIIIDMCPLVVDKYKKKYDKKFITTS